MNRIVKFCSHYNKKRIPLEMDRQTSSSALTNSFGNLSQNSNCCFRSFGEKCNHTCDRSTLFPISNFSCSEEFRWEQIDYRSQSTESTHFRSKIQNDKSFHLEEITPASSLVNNTGYQRCLSSCTYKGKSTKIPCIQLQRSAVFLPSTSFRAECRSTPVHIHPKMASFSFASGKDTSNCISRRLDHLGQHSPKDNDQYQPLYRDFDQDGILSKLQKIRIDTNEESHLARDRVEWPIRRMEYISGTTPTNFLGSNRATDPETNNTQKMGSIHRVDSIRLPGTQKSEVPNRN